MPDLCAYCHTDKPDLGHDKRNMAKDIRQVAAHFGYERIALVGHDRGARVATRFAKDHRGVVERLAVLDNIPTRVVFNVPDGSSQGCADDQIPERA
jgi:haloacetate dehalogenase